MTVAVGQFAARFSGVDVTWEALEQGSRQGNRQPNGPVMSYRCPRCGLVMTVESRGDGWPGCCTAPMVLVSEKAAQ